DRFNRFTRRFERVLLTSVALVDIGFAVGDAASSNPTYPLWKDAGLAILGIAFLVWRVRIWRRQSPGDRSTEEACSDRTRASAGAMKLRRILSLSWRIPTAIVVGSAAFFVVTLPVWIGIFLIFYGIDHLSRGDVSPWAIVATGGGLLVVSWRFALL